MRTKQGLKNNNKKPRPGTYFEQVPLAVVKRVAAAKVSKHGKPASAKRGGVPARSTP